MSNNYYSLERFLIVRAAMACFAILFLTAVVLSLNPIGMWASISIVLFIFFVCLYFSFQIYLVTLKMVQRFDEHARMLSIENYGDIPSALFDHGAARKLQESLSSLTSKFDQRKSKYDEKIVMIYQLIDQLNTPIAVFNSCNHLVYFNESFSSINDIYLNTKVKPQAESIGLHKNGSTWLYDKPGWEIRSSRFIESENEHELLVFVNIDSALREREISSWANIIRVLTHEINNSLTPINMLSEGLKTTSINPKEVEALAAISDRCHHLKDFVARYSSVSKPYSPQRALFSPYELTSRINILYPAVEIVIDDSVESIYADISFIEQVCINLIKNAFEAGASTVTMRIEAGKSTSKIYIIDDGKGISNLENMFVPLYTTKENGQGIGLSFCRKIIDGHDGKITVKNNQEHGAIFEITLPKGKQD